MEILWMVIGWVVVLFVMCLKEADWKLKDAFYYFNGSMREWLGYSIKVIILLAVIAILCWVYAEGNRVPV